MRRAVTLLELLVAIAIVAVLTGLILAGVQKVRGAAATVDCQNRLRQVGLAAHHFHDVERRLPPGHRSLVQRDLMPYTGWPVSLLPFVERESLFRTVRPAFRASFAPFVDPPHVGLATVVPAFICPADSRVTTPQISERTKSRIAFTSYLGVAGQAADDRRDGMLYQNSVTNFASCTDGLSQTLLFGERPPSPDFQFGWWYAGFGQRGTGGADMVLGVREPNRQRIASGSPCGPGRYPFRAADGFRDPCGMFHFWSPHGGGANFAKADGSVSFIAYSANAVMPALASRAGGEIATIPE